jgi:hypothetical protein
MSELRTSAQIEPVISKITGQTALLYDASRYSKEQADLGRLILDEAQIDKSHAGGSQDPAPFGGTKPSQLLVVQAKDLCFLMHFIDLFFCPPR